MLNVAGVLDSSSRVVDGAHSRRLLRMAALVTSAAVMFLAPSAAEAATIFCVTEDVESCDGTPDTYVGGEGEVSNIWKFFTGGTNSTLLYTLEISGIPLTTFDLDVLDRVVTQEELETAFEGDPPLVNFPNAVCIPTFDEDECGLFDVFATFAEGQDPAWESPGYLLQITWFENSNPLSSPPEDGNNTILKAPDFSIFTEELEDILYLQEPVPDDGTISGRGDGFSTHGAFRFTEPVPEPASLILVGTGLGGLLIRSRWRRRGR